MPTPFWFTATAVPAQRARKIPFLPLNMPFNTERMFSNWTSLSPKTTCWSYPTFPSSPRIIPANAYVSDQSCPPHTAIHTLTLAQLKQYDCGSHTLSAFPKQIAVPGTHIPTFDEVLDLAPQGTFDFNVETKIFPNHPELSPGPEQFVLMIDQAVKRHHLQSRVILQSFDFRTLRAMKALDPSIRRSALFGDPKYDTMMGITDSDKDFVSLGRKSEATILSPSFELVTPEKVAAAHAAGLQVMPYTVDKPEDWRKVADAKVDAIITDDPEALLIWLHARSLHP
jgi:glycerophosphoryl diester phosphodiesterase